jgi:AraC-like DNA-binding protein
MQQTFACRHLTGIVHSYLQVNATSPTPYPVMPDGTQAIFFSCQGSLIGGALSRMRELQLLQTGEYFGIRFYPGALRHFFKLDLAEITDQFADSGYFPSREFRILHEQIYQHHGFHERALRCEQWLLRNYNPAPVTHFDQALSLIYQSMGNIRMQQLSELVGWSSRHLSRVFRLHTGLEAKNFSQIIRIQNVCKRLYQAPEYLLSSALELGYFDQSHLIKDFRKRLSSTPGAFIHRFMSDFYNT